MIKIKKEFSYGILAIVAIVAIVALFNLSSTKVITTTESSIEESKDLVGEASRAFGISNKQMKKSITLTKLDKKDIDCETYTKQKGSNVQMFQCPNLPTFKCSNVKYC